jgi:2-keto-4-pentenoate hydratase/2-oxohepta-3-ene-1,7-dioic acid hydratase in catechol pathway
MSRVSNGETPSARVAKIFAALAISDHAGSDVGPARCRAIGDVMRVEIDGIGHIENTVRAEPL